MLQKRQILNSKRSKEAIELTIMFILYSEHNEYWFYNDVFFCKQLLTRRSQAEILAFNY